VGDRAGHRRRRARADPRHPPRTVEPSQLDQPVDDTESVTDASAAPAPVIFAARDS
jgi:hypothetical protein